MRLHGLALTHAVRPGADSVEPGRGGAVEHLQDLLAPGARGSAPKEPAGTRAACSTSVYVFQPTTLYSAGGHPTTKRVPLTRTNASRSCRAMPPKDRAERSSFGGDETFRLGSERSTAEAAVARSTVAAAPARWRRCCVLEPTDHGSLQRGVVSAVPATEGVLRVQRTRGCSSRDASAASARLASTAKSERDDARGGAPNAARFRGPREATALVATMLGAVCVRRCVRSTTGGRARVDAPSTTLAVSKPRDFFDFRLPLELWNVHVRGEARPAFTKKRFDENEQRRPRSQISGAAHTTDAHGSRAKTLRHSTSAAMGAQASRCVETRARNRKRDLDAQASVARAFADVAVINMEKHLPDPADPRGASAP